LKIRQDEKVARCNWRSNLSEISRQYTVGWRVYRGLKRSRQSSDGKDLDVCPTNGQHSLVSRRVASLFQEMHAFVALHSGCEPVRLILRQDEKVARCNWRSNLPEISRQYTVVS
jgi:hypothetical protein